MTFTCQKRIQHIVNQIITGYQPEKIILFGSCAQGTPTESSDIDLCLIKPFTGLPIEEKRKLLRILWEGGFDYSFEPDFHVYTPQKFDYELERHDPFVKEIAKGKVLYERI